jgi:hypothetical protein
MKTEFISQYGHTWRVFEKIVKDFDRDAWIRAGHGTCVPVRIAFHILQGTKYYFEDSTSVLFPSKIAFERSCWETAEEDLPSQKDILACLDEFQIKTEKWLSEMDLGAENKSFEWAGKTKLGVVLFLLRHNLYHIGQLSSLLIESRNGDAEDHYVKAL